MTLFEYAVIKQEKRDKDGDITDDAAVVVPVTTILANDESQATMIASRAIPEDVMGDIDRLSVVIRPF